MTLLFLLALSLMAIVFFCLWLDVVTRPGRHHDHLTPATPRSFRADR